MPKIRWTRGAEITFGKLPLSEQAPITAEVARIAALADDAPEFSKVIVLGPDRIFEAETDRHEIAFRKTAEGYEVLDLISKKRTEELKVLFHGRPN